LLGRAVELTGRIHVGIASGRGSAGRLRTGNNARRLEQLAAWELHNIMQFVTFEVCARRIRVAACTVELQIATANAAVHKITPAMPCGCMMLFLTSGQS